MKVEDEKRLRPDETSLDSDEYDDSIAEFLGYSRKKTERPKSSDILLGYWRRRSVESYADFVEWDFKILRDGRLIYIHPFKRKTRYKATFRLPQSCIDELLAVLRPREGELKELFRSLSPSFFHSCRERFMFLGYEVSGWVVHRTPLDAIAFFPEGSKCRLDWEQENTMMDIFDAACAILKTYGFEVTREEITTSVPPEPHS